MALPALGDERKKGGENVWISRHPIDLVRREAQPVSSSETTARRTSSEHRKVGAREARREAERRNGGKPRDCCKAGSRDGSEPREGTVTGAGWRIRSEVVRGVSRRLPWSRRDRPGRRLSDTTSARCQRVIVDVAPRSTGGFGRSVTRGCVASGVRFWPCDRWCPVDAGAEGPLAVGISRVSPRGWPGARPRRSGG